MKYDIEYPSGIRFKQEGTFQLVELPTVGVAPVIDAGEDAASMLDARAIVRLDGKRIYGPRTNKNLFKPFIEWLEENPTWDKQ